MIFVWMTTISFPFEKCCIHSIKESKENIHKLPLMLINLLKIIILHYKYLFSSCLSRRFLYVISWVFGSCWHVISILIHRRTSLFTLILMWELNFQTYLEISHALLNFSWLKSRFHGTPIFLLNIWRMKYQPMFC